MYWAQGGRTGAIMYIAIVMGLSGAGKSLALRALEDNGFFCIDNLPSNLLLQLVDDLGSYSDIDKVALGLDSRTPALEFTEKQVEQLRLRGHEVKIVYLTARDDVLIKRFSETRRTHPLSRQGFVDESIQQERALMLRYEKMADYVMDTSNWRPTQLTEALGVLFQREKGEGIVLQIRSFGFKHGVPPDADWVVDMRFLPNPYWLPELRSLSGKDEAVQMYLDQEPMTGMFLREFADLLFPLLAAYEREGKPRLLLCLGCTGGQHRSVYMAERLEAMAREQGINVLLQHRDVSQ